jgi:hypothetical protein
MPPAVNQPLRLRAFTVRFVADDQPSHEQVFVDGHLMHWRETDRCSQPEHPVLEISVSRAVAWCDDADWWLIPLVDSALIQRHVSLRTLSGEPPVRMLPLGIVDFVVSNGGNRGLAGVTLRSLWLIKDAPFGTLAWKLVLGENGIESNDFVETSNDVRTHSADVAVSIGCLDCLDLLTGALEVRDAMARGRVQGSPANLSTLTWLVEDEGWAAVQAPIAGLVDVVRDWIAITRTTGYRAWAKDIIDEVRGNCPADSR